MTASIPTMAQQIARAARDFLLEQTGHAPTTVSVVLSGAMLVITLQGALTPAELAIAQKAGGAAQIQEFHRQLFASSSAPLLREIKRITGVDVRESVAEVEPATGTVVHAFTSGTLIQVFRLSEELPLAVATAGAPSPLIEAPSA